MARAAVVATAIVATTRLLRRVGSPVGRYIVDGDSMLPAYKPGDRLLVDRTAYLHRAPAIGDVVVLRDPEREGHLLVKRIAKAPDEPRPEPSSVWVLGDNAAESRDSRAFGTLPRSAIVGKVWRRY